MAGLAVRDDPSVVALVARAASASQGVWNEIVKPYAPRVWSICTRFRLSNHDIEDVARNMWLLVEQWGKLQSLPRCTGGWPRPRTVNASGW